jgi:hypothetical protein
MARATELKWVRGWAKKTVTVRAPASVVAWVQV